MILFITDMFSPVGHVVKKAIEQPTKTIEQALHILFSGKGPERRTIDYSVCTQFSLHAYQLIRCLHAYIHSSVYMRTS